MIRRVPVLRDDDGEAGLGKAPDERVGERHDLMAVFDRERSARHEVRLQVDHQEGVAGSGIISGMAGFAPRCTRERQRPRSKTSTTASEKTNGMTR